MSHPRFQFAELLPHLKYRLVQVQRVPASLLTNLRGNGVRVSSVIHRDIDFSDHVYVLSTVDIDCDEVANEVVTAELDLRSVNGVDLEVSVLLALLEDFIRGLLNDFWVVVHCHRRGLADLVDNLVVLHVVVSSRVALLSSLVSGLGCCQGRSPLITVRVDPDVLPAVLHLLCDKLRATGLGGLQRNVSAVNELLNLETPFSLRGRVNLLPDVPLLAFALTGDN